MDVEVVINLLTGDFHIGLIDTGYKDGKQSIETCLSKQPKVNPKSQFPPSNVPKPILMKISEL